MTCMLDSMKKINLELLEVNEKLWARFKFYFRVFSSGNPSKDRQ